MQSESMSSSDETVGDSESPSTKSYAERRKSSKPIMEKRRRARINSSLNELKAILLDALKKDTTRHSKLEKADILEMTVRYLKNVERQRMSVSLSIDPTVVDKYKAGFNECRNEVMRFLSTCEGVTVNVRTRLLNHLAACLQSIQSQPGIFDDSNFDCHNRLPSALLVNGHNQQPVQLTVPETGFYPTSIAARTIPSTQYHPVLDPKLTLIQPRVSAPIVLKEGIQLTSSINALGPGNITVLLPTSDGVNTAAFFTTPFSSSNASVSPERPIYRVTSPPDKSPKEPAKPRQISPSLLLDPESKQATSTGLKSENQVKPTETSTGNLRKMLSNPIQTNAFSSKNKIPSFVGEKMELKLNDDRMTSKNSSELTQTSTNNADQTNSSRKRRRTSSNCDVASLDSGVSLCSPKGSRQPSTDASRDSGEVSSRHGNVPSPMTNKTDPFASLSVNTTDSLDELLTTTTCSASVTCRRNDTAGMTSKGNPWRPWSKSNLISDS